MNNICLKILENDFFEKSFYEELSLKKVAKKVKKIKRFKKA
jgi:hypothetical protein